MDQKSIETYFLGAQTVASGFPEQAAMISRHFSTGKGELVNENLKSLLAASQVAAILLSPVFIAVIGFFSVPALQNKHRQNSRLKHSHSF